MEKSWYVLHTRSRFENVVCEALGKKSVEAFLPRVRVASKRRDRKSTILQPLFPGYLFVNASLTPEGHLEILKTTGVVSLIGTSKGPLPVPRECVESLKIMEQAADSIAVGNRFRQGSRILVTRGPFQGVTGLFVRTRGQGRVVVQIQVLGQYAAVDVHEGEVEPLP